MVSYEENYIKSRPQSLCKMCGKCCRVATNVMYTYKELQEMALSGNDYAKDFIKIFEPYESIEAAKAVDISTVDNIINVLKENGSYDPESLTFYKCRYLLDNNLCSIYEERPALCIYCPSSGWVVTPPGCGFESWLFLKREEDMQRVRKAKEELLELKVMRQRTNDEEILRKVDVVEKKIQNTIKYYAQYGSCFW